MNIKPTVWRCTREERQYDGMEYHIHSDTRYATSPQAMAVLWNQGYTCVQLENDDEH